MLPETAILREMDEGCPDHMSRDADECSHNYACTNAHAHIVPTLTHKSTNSVVGTLNNCVRLSCCSIQGHHAQSSQSNMFVTHTYHPHT